MDALSSSIIKGGQFISLILNELDEAEQKGETERITWLREQLNLQIKATVAKIKLLHEKELPAQSEKPP